MYNLRTLLDNTSYITYSPAHNTYASTLSRKRIKRSIRLYVEFHLVGNDFINYRTLVGGERGANSTISSVTSPVACGASSN